MTESSAASRQVFVKKTRKTSTNVFITALASSDLIACLLRPFYVGFIMARNTPESLWIEFLYSPLNFVTICNSTLLTAAIAFDRYDAVCRPHTRLMSYRGAQLLALFCFIVSLPMTAPIILMYFHPPVSVRLAKHIECLSMYVISLILVIAFYVQVYKAVLFRTKVRTKWGGRFTGISTAAESSVCMTGQTEMSAMPPSREFTRLNSVAETRTPPAGNHVEEGAEPSAPCQIPPPQCSPATNPTADLEISCVSEDKRSIAYQSLSNSEAQAGDFLDSRLTPPCSSVANPTYSPAFQMPISSTAGRNLAVPNCSQIPASSNFPERTGSTGRHRRPSGRGKSSKTVAARMQHKTTRMLLLTTIVFFVTWVPYMCVSSLSVHHILTHIHVHVPINDTLSNNTLSNNILSNNTLSNNTLSNNTLSNNTLPNGTHQTTLDTLSLVFNTASHFLFINNAVNPFIYVLANRQFRNDCIREVRKLLRR
ncbi:muscarinic acetylcholine receptor M4-like [Acanthaster planci]|uniref:Muscarinic acetylcholine receptor M4-like n=1 Tax=Acanthaster planci TaxID=133434 RepID=A0A8B7YY02_ACAPL|nr:muscarinic acetylcholine receptor M4-like [Acanthaster planci]